jgi:hypothetical protein
MNSHTQQKEVQYRQQIACDPRITKLSGQLLSLDLILRRYAGSAKKNPSAEDGCSRESSEARSNFGAKGGGKGVEEQGLPTTSTKAGKEEEEDKMLQAILEDQSSRASSGSVHNKKKERPPVGAREDIQKAAAAASSAAQDGGTPPTQIVVSVGDGKESGKNEGADVRYEKKGAASSATTSSGSENGVVEQGKAEAGRKTKKDEAEKAASAVDEGAQLDGPRSKHKRGAADVSGDASGVDLAREDTRKRRNSSCSDAPAKGMCE